jgi:hypothetical protein
MCPSLNCINAIPRKTIISRIKPSISMTPGTDPLNANRAITSKKTGKGMINRNPRPM